MIADTPINVDRLRYELRDHPDRHFVEYLCDGLTYGFDTLVPDIPLPSKVCKNLQSALKDSDTVTELIHKEVIKGFLQGPFHALPFSSYRVSPIGVAYGKYSGKPRLIVDLSSPHEDDDHPSFTDGEVPQVSSRGQQPAVCRTNSIRGFLGLTPIVDNLWETAIAPNTKQAYYTGFNNFIRFLLLAGILTDVKLSDLQVSEDMLIYFVAHCYNSDLAYSTIKLYVCGIKFMCLKHNIPFPGVDGLSRMHAILGGVKRSRRKISKPRYPVTFNILKDVIGYLRKTSHLFEDLMMRTACIVAFFGFLRCGEFTVGTSFDYTQHLCVSDLIVSDEYVMLHLKKSKTDPFREGVKIKLFKVGGIICPYAACCEYLSARMQFSPASHDPLFVVQNGQALTRSIFISKFKHTLQCIGINSELYNGHSFRIGAATSAAAAHVEDHLIKVLGRWSSDAYCRYIKTPQSCLRDAQIALTNSS
ncbi:uncharacterized protein [Argopecten irradians]|uniref:uncharacterized protein n=1 Tax=Argopecten irradians TaxID=31199 RepID=UPI003718A515